VRLWEGRGRFAGTCSAKTYLFGIARNVLRETWRRSRYQAVAHQAIRQGQAGAQLREPPQPDSILGIREAAEALQRAQDCLTDKQRLAFHLVVEVGALPTEAARQVGCSTNTLYQRLHDAKARLRKALDRVHR